MKKYLGLFTFLILALYPFTEHKAMVEFQAISVFAPKDTTVHKHIIIAEKRIKLCNKLAKIGLYFLWFFYISFIIWLVAFFLILPYRHFKNAQSVYKKLKLGLWICLGLMALIAIIGFLIVFVLTPI